MSYGQKHNDENGEHNRDGMNDNLSWNCGAEGPVEDRAIEGLRCRQIKNFLALTIIAFGTPMLLMGDEIRRSQRGNNNAYCQDNEISWLDWNLLQRHPEIHRFAKMLIAFRSRRDVATENARLTLNQFLRQAQLEWHGTSLNHPDWSDDSHSIAFTAKSLRKRFSIHAMLNAYRELFCSNCQQQVRNEIEVGGDGLILPRQRPTTFVLGKTRQQCRDRHTLSRRALQYS